MAAALGSDVIVVEARDRLLSHVDEEITASLVYHLRKCGVVFRMGEKVVSVKAPDNEPGFREHECDRAISRSRTKKPRYLPGLHSPSRSMTIRKKPLKCSARRRRTAAVQRVCNTSSEFVFESSVCLDKIMIWQHAGPASHKNAFYWGST